MGRLAKFIYYYTNSNKKSGPRIVDLTVSGAAPLSLPNAVAGAMLSLTQKGKCVQASTPSPNSPSDIKCNNGAIKFIDQDIPEGYRRLLGFSMNNDCYFVITDFRLNGSDYLSFSFSASTACNVLGCYTSTSAQTNYSLYVSTTAGSKYMRYNGGTYDSVIEPNVQYSVSMGPYGAEGLSTSPEWEEKEFEAESDLCIGTTSTGATSAKLTGSLFGEIIVDGRLSLIPVERISDGVLGYYDEYNEEFYTPTVGTPTSLGYDHSYDVMQIDGSSEITVNSKNYSLKTAFGVTGGEDTYDLVSGKFTHYTNIYVFTGEESFTTSSAYGSALLISSFATSVGAKKDCTPLCTHFIGKPMVSSGTQDANTCFFNSSGHFYFRTSETAANFKTWLKTQYDAGTPVILVYATSTQSTETFTKKTINIADGTNTVSVKTAQISGLEFTCVYRGTDES